MITYQWESIKEQQPLVHQITNEVTVNDCANVTLATGASPVMAYAIEEAAEMASQSQALVLNLGTLTPIQVKAMIKAGKAANQKQIPVALDPVGAGATTLRLQSVEAILKEVQVAVIRGNASEMATLCGMRSGKGVDAVATDIQALIPQVRELARQLQTVCAVSGAVDYVTDGKQEAKIHNGTASLARVTGTGCMTTAITGCCLGSGIPSFEGAITALVAMGLAGEWAEQESGAKQIGTFRIRLFDAMTEMSSQWLEQKGRVDVTSLTR